MSVRIIIEPLAERHLAQAAQLERECFSDPWSLEGLRAELTLSLIHIFLWPENKSFPIGSTEGFYFRKEEKLYFSAWYEDPDYRVEIIIRDFDTGEVIKKMPGSIRLMPDGQQWLLL